MTTRTPLISAETNSFRSALLRHEHLITLHIAGVDLVHRRFLAADYTSNLIEGQFLMTSARFAT